MNKELRIPLRAVLYKEEGEWIAHCLEFDLIGDGKTRDEALKNMSEAIAVQLRATLKFENSANLFSPADGRYFEMFAAGKDVATAEMNLGFKVDSVTIEDVAAREYSDSELAPTT